VEISLINPASSESRKGNDVTSDRWKGILEDLGHTVTIAEEYESSEPDLLLSLHAKKSSASIKAFKETSPERPVILALTGTDLYRDLDNSPDAQRSVELADRLVVLQSRALDRIDSDYHKKTHVIYQSVSNPPSAEKRPTDDNNFVVVQLAHIRPVKDPLRLPYAVRKLPKSVPLHAYHLGGILDVELGRKLEKEASNNNRFTRLGEKPRTEALRYVMGADLMVVSSRLEGGANVLSEAIVCETPVLATDVPGNRGILGGYPGYFPVEDHVKLSEKLQRAETDNSFYEELKETVNVLGEIVKPERERKAWKDLLETV
jgi:putative glycosyltransferase (TIGR04348 family)